MKRSNRKRALIALLALSLQAAAPAIAGAQDAADQPLDFNKIKERGKPPRPLKQVPPVYPYAMSRAGLIGEVDVSFVIDKEGKVQNPVVIQSNNPWFERPAIVAILKWQFTPAEIDGQKVSTRARQKIVFDLWGGGQNPWTISNAKGKKTLPPELQWDIAPEPINTAFPVYPFEALQVGLRGKTRILYIISTKGDVIETRLLEATTPEMGQAVLAMIDTWRFKPARKKDGTLVATAMAMDHEFTPDGRNDVPVSDEARNILDHLKDKPQAIVSAGELDQPLKPLSRRPPVFPLGLQKAGQSGEATIEFFVDKNGDAQLPRIISSSAPEFGYAAAQAVATWRFEVPKKNSKPVITRVRIPIEFIRPVGAPIAGK